MITDNQLTITNERKKELKILLKKVQISFKDYDLLNLALSHRSYVNEHGIHQNNEKLEFLGDSILGFVITEFLFLNYPNFSEGVLARIKSVVISENTLSKVASDIDLNKYLLIGKGEESSGGRFKKTIVADAFEAFLGSYYLDSSFEKVKAVIIKFFRDEIDLVVKDKHEKDYKTLLQELSQKRFKSCPKYTLIDKKGPEHDRTFFVKVFINDKNYGIGDGKSIKEAEKFAAKNLYNKVTATAVRSNPRNRNKKSK